MILVIGATGRIGGETARLLLGAGVGVRALVRDAAKAAMLFDLGAELAVGDLADPVSLGVAMDGIDRVLIVSVQDLRQAELQGNAVQAAVGARVSHIVKVSGIGPSISPGGPAEIGRQHWRTEHEIEETGVPFTFLRPGFFMQNLLATAAPMVSRTGVLAAPMGSTPIAMVDARDIAAAAAAVLTGAEHANRVYDITGPRAFTYEQLAGVLADATGRPVRYADIPRALAAKGLRSQGKPDWYVHHLDEMAQLFRAGAGASVSTAVRDLTGFRPRSVEDFVVENVAAFTPRGGSIVQSAAHVGLSLASRASSVLGRP